MDSRAKMVAPLFRALLDMVEDFDEPSKFLVEKFAVRLLPRRRHAVVCPSA